MAEGELEEPRREETFTRDQMETIFSRRQSERRALLEDSKAAVVDALKPQLERMAGEIRDANHLKREFGEKIETMATDVRSMHDKLRLVDDLQLQAMSRDERAIFPAAMRSAVAARAAAGQADQKAERRMNSQLVLATAVGSLASLLIAGIALAAYAVSHGATLQP